MRPTDRLSRRVDVASRLTDHLLQRQDERLLTNLPKSPEVQTILRSVKQELAANESAATTATSTSKRFLVALSFPGESRGFVSQVASRLETAIGRDRVLYDRFYEAELARPNLDAYLQNLYQNESELVVVFLGRDYDRTEWPGMKLRALRDLLKSKKDSSTMFVRLDDADVAGSFSIDGYVSTAGRSPADVEKCILARLDLLEANRHPEPVAAFAEPHTRPFPATDLHIEPLLNAGDTSTGPVGPEGVGACKLPRSVTPSLGAFGSPSKTNAVRRLRKHVSSHPAQALFAFCAVGLIAMLGLLVSTPPAVVPGAALQFIVGGALLCFLMRLRTRSLGDLSRVEASRSQRLKAWTTALAYAVLGLIGAATILDPLIPGSASLTITLPNDTSNDPPLRNLRVRVVPVSFLGQAAGDHIVYAPFDRDGSAEVVFGLDRLETRVTIEIVDETRPAELIKTATVYISPFVRRHLIASRVLIDLTPTGTAIARDFRITRPGANSVALGQVIDVSGVGADPTGTVEIEVFTNEWYAQSGKAVIKADGTWTFSPVHLAGNGPYNNHTIRASVVKDGHREKSVTVAGIVRKP